MNTWSPSVQRGSGRIRGMPRLIASLRWADRTPIERVRLYTVGSLYVLFVLNIALALIGALSSMPGWGLDVFAVLLAVVLVAGGLFALHAVLQRGEPRRPGRLAIGLLLGGAVVGQAVALTRPSESGFAITLLVVLALAWGLGGMDDRRVWWALVAVSPVLAWSTSRELGSAAFAAGVAAFLVFTVRSSLWLLDVVEELEAGRHIGAALAVAEERLRFSRDVHDVLGRRLSEIAVQAELASAYVVRGDGRAADTLADVRATAHTALREARELARGYRPVDLDAGARGRRRPACARPASRSAPTSTACRSRGRSRSLESYGRRSPTSCGTPAPPGSPSRTTTGWSRSATTVSSGRSAAEGPG